MHHRPRGIAGMNRLEIVIHVDDDCDPLLTDKRNRLREIAMRDTLKHHDVEPLGHTDADDLVVFNRRAEHVTSLVRRYDCDVNALILRCESRPDEPVVTTASGVSWKNTHPHSSLLTYASGSSQWEMPGRM